MTHVPTCIIESAFLVLNPKKPNHIVVPGAMPPGYFGGECCIVGHLIYIG